MSNPFLYEFKKFVRRHSQRKARGAGSRRKVRTRGTRKSRRRITRKLRKLAFGKKKTRPPSSLSIFPDKSPQLQKPGEPTKLNVFTAKNIALRDSQGTEYNAIINDRLAYRRAPRGQDVQDFSDILYGPVVTLLTSSNYKKLKKGDVLYYDRGSVAFRGPLIFKGHRRGPELLLEVKDAVYDKNYLFSITVKRLKDERLYRVVKKNKTRKKGARKGGMKTTRSRVPRIHQGTPRLSPWTWIKKNMGRKKVPQSSIVQAEEADEESEEDEEGVETAGSGRERGEAKSLRVRRNLDDEVGTVVTKGAVLCRYIAGTGLTVGRVKSIEECRDLSCESAGPKKFWAQTKGKIKDGAKVWWKARQNDGNKIMKFVWNDEDGLAEIPVITHDMDPDNFLAVGEGEGFTCPDLKDEYGDLPLRYVALSDDGVNRKAKNIILDPKTNPNQPALEVAIAQQLNTEQQRAYKDRQNRSYNAINQHLRQTNKALRDKERLSNFLSDKLSRHLVPSPYPIAKVTRDTRGKPHDLEIQRGPRTAEEEKQEDPKYVVQAVQIAKNHGFKLTNDDWRKAIKAAEVEHIPQGNVYEGFRNIVKEDATRKAAEELETERAIGAEEMKGDVPED